MQARNKKVGDKSGTHNRKGKPTFNKTVNRDGKSLL